MKTSFGEFKILTIREHQTEEIYDDPKKSLELWKKTVPKAEWFDQEKEAFVVFLLNARYKFKGMNLVSLGFLDQCIVHPREVFRPAILGAAHSIIIAHNHPSGNTTPSDADIKVTKDLISASRILKINILDHLIVGGVGESYCSLRELGYFY